MIMELYMFKIILVIIGFVFATFNMLVSSDVPFLHLADSVHIVPTAAIEILVGALVLLLGSLQFIQ
jgi:hypothetical protein